jgi:hypothetical protein
VPVSHPQGVVVAAWGTGATAVARLLLCQQQQLRLMLLPALLSNQTRHLQLPLLLLLHLLLHSLLLAPTAPALLLLKAPPLSSQLWSLCKHRSKHLHLERGLGMV